MKFNILKWLFYVVGLLVLPLLSFANNQPDADLAGGNALYARAHYKDALSVYQQLVDSGFKSSALYFNIGNAYYKNDDLPSAILYYEKAHKLAPGDDDINYNLKYANLKTTDKIDEVPEFFLTRWWKGFILSFSTGALAVWSIILILMASGVLIVYFFAGSVIAKKTAFYAAILFFILGISAIFMANRQLSYFDEHPGAIVFSGSVNVKSSPADKSNTLFVIHDGTKVNVLDSSEDWMKISLANGNEGWIKQSDVKEI